MSKSNVRRAGWPPQQTPRPAPSGPLWLSALGETLRDAVYAVGDAIYFFAFDGWWQVRGEAQRRPARLHKR